MITQPDAQRDEVDQLLAQMDQPQLRVISFLISLMELPHEKLPESPLESEQYSRLLLHITLNVFQEKAMPEEVVVTEKLIRQCDARIEKLKGATNE